MKKESLDWKSYRKQMDSLTVPKDFCERIIIYTQKINSGNVGGCPGIKRT